MTPNHNFTNAKVGDKIYTSVWGKGIIHEILSVDDYSVKVKFRGRTESFTMDGKYRIDDVAPTAFTEPIKVVPASYEPFQEQEMMVWDGDDDIQSAHKRMVFAKHKGWYAGRENGELHENFCSYFWQNALPIHEWEAKVKESKNQKEITEIEDQIAELQAKLEKLKG